MLLCVAGVVVVNLCSTNLSLNFHNLYQDLLLFVVVCVIVMLVIVVIVVLCVRYCSRRRHHANCCSCLLPVLLVLRTFLLKFAKTWIGKTKQKLDCRLKPQKPVGHHRSCVLRVSDICGMVEYIYIYIFTYTNI